MSDEDEKDQESIPKVEDNDNNDNDDDEQSMNVDDAEEDEGHQEEGNNDRENEEEISEIKTMPTEQQPDKEGDDDNDDGSKEGDGEDDGAKEVNEEEMNTSKDDEEILEKDQPPNQDEEEHDDENDDSMDLVNNKEEEEEEKEKENVEKEGEVEEEEEGEESGPVMLGGDIDTPAFFLLTGQLHNPAPVNNANEDANSHVPPPTTVHLPITRLPATLGRSHDTNDPYFFGIGNRKALSRKQCIVYYRDTAGGHIDQKGSQDEKGDNDDGDNDAFYYNKKGISSSKPPQKEKIIRKNQDENPLPIQGFFAIECVGKNRIIVDGMRVEQGEVAMLQHGSTLRVNQYNLYFLLPKDTSEENDDDGRETLTVPNPNYKKIVSNKTKSKSNKRKPKASETTQPPTKKRKSTGKSSSGSGHHGLGGTGGIAAELESLPVRTLLTRMTTAIESNMWDRKHQMIGSAISLHAVKDAARSKKIQRLAAEGDGVARTDIMAWIKETKKYKKWVSQMMTKMEAKSYQSSISKALGKAGYTRTGTTGRHVKWILPAGMENDDEDEDDDDSSSNSSDDDGDDDDDNDDESDDEPNEKEQSEPDDDSGDEKENNDNDDGDSSEDENEGPASEDKEDENEGSEEDA